MRRAWRRLSMLRKRLTARLRAWRPDGWRPAPLSAEAELTDQPNELVVIARHGGQEVRRRYILTSALRLTPVDSGSA
jgi:hypothetical protein